MITLCIFIHLTFSKMHVFFVDILCSAYTYIIYCRVNFYVYVSMWGGCVGIPVCLNYFPVLAVHGVWEEWSPWSLCSFTCGRGHRTRTRVCTPPQHGGRGCDGPETQSKLCNIALCPGLSPFLSFSGV